MKKFIFTAITFLLFQISFAQLNNFTLTVTHTNETCPNGGTLGFTVSNTVPGSTIVYSVYLLPNTTTPISVLSANSLSGLGAGTYRVVATQSLGNQSGTQFVDETILSQVADLTYQVVSQKEVCGADGVITVNEITGDAVQFELFAGPMIKPLQSSNVFTGLVAGLYQVRAFDACGEGVVQSHTVQNASPALQFTFVNPTVAGCNLVSVGFNFTLVSPTGIVKYPLQIQTTVFPPSGAPIITNTTITGGTQFTTNIPLYDQQPYNYSFTIVDGCGIQYVVNGTINNISDGMSYELLTETCVTKRIRFINISALQLISAPAGYPNTLPQNFTSQISGGTFTTNPFPVGTYVFTATGLCGEQQNFTITITPQSFPPYWFAYGVTCSQGSLAFYNVSQIVLVSAPVAYTGPLPYDFSSTINSANIAVLENLPHGNYTFNVLDPCNNPVVLNAVILPLNPTPNAQLLKSCTDNRGSVKLTAAGQLYGLQMISAPAAYTGTLPQNFTPSILLNSECSIDNLPPGIYVFTSTNACNITNNTTVTIPNYTETVNALDHPHCGSFDVEVNFTSVINSEDTFWLQKYYPLSNSWGHPGTAVMYPAATAPNATNSYPLFANATAFNLTFTGEFRVIKRHLYYQTGISSPQNCIKVLHEFEYDGQPDIIDIYSISCNTTFEVVVEAVGLGPLIYRITTKNGQPFLVQNGNSSLFTGLAPAVYNFQVEDVCGNILNSTFEVNIPNPLEITPSAICQGQTASLSVPQFDFLTYQWWKGTNTTTILSTTSSLTFPSFNALTDAGTYYVSTVYNGNPNSCLNATLSFTISSDGFNPLAGNDNSVSYCGNQGTINLFSLLQGNYMNTGDWEEVSSSGTLNGSNWNSTNVLPGIYTFNYRVDGNCDLFDEAQISIEIKAIPNAPTASTDPILCDGEVLNLYATTVANATYSWSGPNNFSSSLQNPQINSISSAINGIYTVKVIVNGCESGTDDVEVTVNPLPEFEIEKGCDGSRFLLKAVVVNDSFDAATAIFNWTGPNGFSETGNPIDVTGSDNGDYSLNVITDSGCLESKTIEVLGTFCEIPNVITPNNDGTNDNFDLTGMEVDKFQVYNRWGRLVYEEYNYTNGWWGQNMHNNELPGSTYYYLLILKTGEEKHGWVLVAR